MEYERDIDGWWKWFFEQVKVPISCDDCPCKNEKENRCAKYGCANVLADKFLTTYSDGEYEWI